MTRRPPLHLQSAAEAFAAVMRDRTGHPWTPVVVGYDTPTAGGTDPAREPDHGRRDAWPS